MSKKRNFHLHYSRLVNGEEFADEYTVKGVKSKQAAEDKLKAICKSAGGPDPVITSNEEV